MIVKAHIILSALFLALMTEGLQCPGPFQDIKASKYDQNLSLGFSFGLKYEAKILEFQVAALEEATGEDAEQRALAESLSMFYALDGPVPQVPPKVVFNPESLFSENQNDPSSVPLVDIDAKAGVAGARLGTSNGFWGLDRSSLADTHDGLDCGLHGAGFNDRSTVQWGSGTNCSFVGNITAPMAGEYLPSIDATAQEDGYLIATWARPSAVDNTQVFAAAAVNIGGAQDSWISLIAVSDSLYGGNYTWDLLDTSVDWPTSSPARPLDILVANETKVLTNVQNDCSYLVRLPTFEDIEDTDRVETCGEVVVLYQFCRESEADEGPFPSGNTIPDKGGDGLGAGLAGDNWYFVGEGYAVYADPNAEDLGLTFGYISWFSSSRPNRVEVIELDPAATFAAFKGDQSQDVLVGATAMGGAIFLLGGSIGSVYWCFIASDDESSAVGSRGLVDSLPASEASSRPMEETADVVSQGTPLGGALNYSALTVGATPAFGESEILPEPEASSGDEKAESAPLDDAKEASAPLALDAGHTGHEDGDDDKEPSAPPIPPAPPSK